MLNAMAQSIIDGKAEVAADLARQAIDQGIDPLDAINSGFVVGIDQVGENYSSGTAFVPDLVLAGAAMKAAMEVLEPELAKQGTERETSGVVVLATIAGDIHDIGKNIVGLMLSVSGFKVYDLGVDVPTPEIVEKVREVDADMVALSALLTTTMMQQEKVIKALEDAGLRDTVKVVVGGAPVTQAWAETIGADGFGGDAIGAVHLAKELIGKD
jgi:corrinoid protein of di/trimethylamine methyltransferase